jgi:hypothetical protein
MREDSRVEQRLVTAYCNRQNSAHSIQTGAHWLPYLLPYRLVVALTRDGELIRYLSALHCFVSMRAMNRTSVRTDSIRSLPRGV